MLGTCYVSFIMLGCFTSHFLPMRISTRSFISKDRYFVVIAFKMLKVEFNFKYTKLVTKVLYHSSQYISVKVNKTLRKSQAQFQ